MVKRKKTKKSRDSPTEKRMRERDGEVAIARGRLAGALKGILNNNTEDSDETDASCSQSSNSCSKKYLSDPQASWRKQSIKTEPGDHQSYVMKLFDRSVDLAQFNVETPLYPICRAWIQNKPNFSKRKNSDLGLVEIKHERDDNDSKLFELNERGNSQKTEDTDVLYLPSPKPLPPGVQTLRIPIMKPHEIKDINFNPDSETAPGREELLTSHLKNWSKVRKRWRMASFKNEERYAASKKILTNMFDSAQVQFRVPVS